MTETFKKEYALKLIIEAVVVALVVWGVQFYFEKTYAPDIAAATLKKENFLNSKKEAYFEAIEVANKVMANYDYGSVNLLDGEKIDPKFLHKHTTALNSFELDVNKAYSKLMVFTSDTSILSSYFRIFVSPPGEKHIPIIAMQNFIMAIRKDLGNETKLPEDYKLLYIVLPSKQDSLP